MTPSRSSRLVERPRLVELVDRGIERPLTLISAPAGSGKTVLLKGWLATGPARGRVANLTLGPEHAHPRQFWTDIVTAAGQVCGELAGLAVPPGGQLGTFVTAARASLADLDEPLVLVLDDLQEVAADSRAIAELWWMLEHAHDSLRLVVATRRDPPLRLQRLRIAGQMTEVRAADLAFTLHEAGELVTALDLAPEDVELLWRRTEGWAAGLRLAELSLHDEADAHAFIAGFAGEDRAVSDYLMSEVIARYPPETLDFLLRTCVAGRVNGDLADALTRTAGGEQALRELEHMEGFVTTGPAGDGWYRYHTLFAGALQAELRRRLPHELPSLHRAAGRWHSEHGTPLEAVRHAVAACDWGLAAEVIGEHWLVLVARGSGAVLLDLGGQIPEEAMRADAELALAMAGLLLEAGELKEADEWLVRAYDLVPSLPSARRRRFAVTSTATSLYRARLQGDVVEALSAARVALDERWDRAVAVEVRALTLANVGIAEFWSGDSDEAADQLQTAAGLALECGNDYVLFVAESYLAAVDLRAGRLSEAFSRARTAIQLAERRLWTGVAHAAIAYATLATVHLSWNELDEAERCGDCARAALAGSTEPLLAPVVAQIRARLLGLRDPVTALEVLRGAGPVARLPAWLRVSMAMVEAELWFALGEPARARKTLAGISSAGMSDFAVGVARLELAVGDPTAALHAVATFLADENDAALSSTRTEAWVIDAIARNAIHDEPGALRALERALDLAEPRGYSNVIVRYGAPVRSLMRRRIAAGTAHREFAGDLLATFDERPPQGEQATAGPLLEPLSDRELALLRFLPTMMSNAEIAGEMFVSVNTVKTHLKHVYRKLDVSDRRGAVRRGRELRLLSRGLAER